MHNKQIEDALFPHNKIIWKVTDDLEKANNELKMMHKKLDQAEMYANRYKELRAIGVLVVEEGSDPKYLKDEDMDAYFEGEQTAMQKLLVEKMAQTKHVLAAKILEKLYDARSQGQSKCDENT